MTETNWRADAESGVDVALAACSLILGLISVSTLIAIGYLNYTRLPWFDAWEHWTEYLKSGDSWTFLFSQHNEHRIPVSRALYLVDQRWFGADARFLLWCTFLAQFGSALVVYRLASSSRALSRVTRMQILGLVLALTFASSQWINFTWTFQVCFVVVFFAAIAAFAALGNSVRQRAAGRRVSAPWLILTIVMALMTTGSMANGLLVWPLLVMMAWCIGLPKGAMAALSAAGAIAIGGYMYGYQPRTGIGVLDALTKMPAIATFAMAYLGSLVDEPFTAVSGAIGLDGTPYRVPLAATVGLLGVVCFFRLLIAAVRHRDTNTPSRLALLHCLAFLGASAGLTALGRVQFPIEDALTTRYVTPSLLFWACLGALAALESATGLQSAGLVRQQRLRIAVVLAAAFAVLPMQLSRIAYATGSERYMTEGEYAVVNNVFAPDAWQRFVGSGMPGRMIPVIRFFRKHHLAAFSQDWTHWLGDPVRAHFLLGSPESDCQGEWISVGSTGESFTPGAVAEGWSFDRKYNRAPDRIVFVDEGFRVAGFATAARRRPDVIARYPELTSDRLGWAAYLPAATSTEMTAFVLLGDGRSLCRLGGRHVPGHYLTAPATKAGDVIAGVEASATGDWARDSLPPGANAPPFFTGTWSSQTQTSSPGELRFGPVTVTSGSRIGLPLMTGPHASGVRVSAIERGSNEVLTTSAPPAGASTWDLWRLDIPAGAPDMLIDYVVEHHAHGEGNWVVVGPPRTLTK